MFDFLRTFAYEPLSRIEGSQSENNFTSKETKVAFAIKGDRSHLLTKQLKFMRMSLKCVLNSHAFRIPNSQIAFALRITIEVELGFYMHSYASKLIFFSENCIQNSLNLWPTLKHI